MSEEPYIPITEYEFSEEDVVINPHNCDLNLVVDKECLLAYPLSNDGFCSLWAGCFATYGVKSGRVAFEVFLTDYIESEDLPKDDQENNYAIRIGWSLKGSALQLGEDAQSYCYSNNARKANNSIFEDYGQTFEKGNSVAAYIDFETDKDKILISFSKNGYDLGMAFEIDKNELQTTNTDAEPVFFPHILTKNTVFEVNFGQRVSLLGDEPFAPIKPEYQMIQKLGLDTRVQGSIAIKEKKDCEIIMLIGLPLSGKTEYALDYCTNNPEKCFYIIGVQAVLDKMRMLGIKKKPNTNVVQDSTKTKLNSEAIDKAIHCMNKLIDIASHLNRNIILDQSNVFVSTRRRKMSLFQGFKRRAIVIVRNDEEYNERLKKLELDENTREISINVIHNMKAGFTLPEVGDLFDSIEYLDLDEKNAKELVGKYNIEGPQSRMQIILSKRAKYDDEKRQNGVKAGGPAQKQYRPGYSGYQKDTNRYFRPQPPATQMQYRRPAIVQNRFTTIVNPIPLQTVHIHPPYNYALPQQVIQPNWNPYNPMQQQQQAYAIPPHWPQQQQPTWGIPMYASGMPPPQAQYWPQHVATAHPPTWFNPNMPPGQVIQISPQQQQQQQQQSAQGYNDWTPAMATNVSNAFGNNPNNPNVNK